MKDLYRFIRVTGRG